MVGDGTTARSGELGAIQPGPSFRLIGGVSFEHLAGDCLRSHDPAHCRYYTRAEAEALLRRAGLENVEAAW